MGCAVELCELVLGRPAGHSASPRDGSSDPLVHVYSTMAPMGVMGASFPTTPTSNRSTRVPAHGPQAGHRVQRDVRVILVQQLPKRVVITLGIIGIDACVGRSDRRVIGLQAGVLPPGPMSRSSYVDDNNCLIIVSSLPFV
jgi:hypothetical protein